MKLKKLLFGLGFTGLFTLSLASCDEKEVIENSEVVSEGDSGDNGNNGDNSNNNTVTKSDATPTIYLAGDSTVKTYNDNQYIGGWGQYLDKFLDDEIVVRNCAQGGRSARSFINEGRLYDRKNATYTFNENGGDSIADGIKAGDFLFIQFGHNDDSTKSTDAVTNAAERMVPLGEKDANGIYPTTKPTETTITKDSSGSATLDCVNDQVKTIMGSTSSTLKSYLKDSVSKFGDSYYEYGNGTYKGYLKEYIDFAREKGATPVLVTPVARVKFSGSEIISGPGLHGENFAYVTAMKQLAEEENCMCIDLFSKTKNLLETATSTYADFLMALKPNGLTGTWPMEFDYSYKNTKAGYTGIEATHYNKYGAFIEAAYVAEELKTKTLEGLNNNQKEEINFKDRIKVNPETYIEPSNNISKGIISKIENTLDVINIKDPNYSYYNSASAINTINSLPSPSNITKDNYVNAEAELKTAYLDYYKVNVDDRANITNSNKLLEVENAIIAAISAARPEVEKTVVYNGSNLVNNTDTADFSDGDYTYVVQSSKSIVVEDKATSVNYNDTDYSFTKRITFKGSVNTYLQFDIEKTCYITIVGSSTGDARTFGVYGTDGKVIGTCDAVATGGVGANSVLVETTSSKTVRVASTGSSVIIFGIIIEYIK